MLLVYVCYIVVVFLPQAIADVEQKLMDFRKEFRKTVGYPSANYVTVSGVQVSTNYTAKT